MKKEVSWLFIAALLMFLSVGVFTSCDDDDEDNTEDNIEDNTQQDVSVTGVSLDVGSLSLFPGGSYTLTATVAPENAADKTVAWSCSDEDIAQLTDNEDGTATITVSDEAEENNECTVTVTTEDGGFTAECMVTVKEFVKVSVNLDADEDTGALSETVSLAADGTLNLQFIALIGNDEVAEGITWSATVIVNGTPLDLVDIGVMDESGLIQVPGTYISYLAGEYPITITARMDGDGDSPYKLSVELTEGDAEGEYILTITGIVYDKIVLDFLDFLDNNPVFESTDSYSTKDIIYLQLTDENAAGTVTWSADMDDDDWGYIEKDGFIQIKKSYIATVGHGITITAEVENDNNSPYTFTLELDSDSGHITIKIKEESASLQ